MAKNEAGQKLAICEFLKVEQKLFCGTLPWPKAPLLPTLDFLGAFWAAFPKQGLAKTVCRGCRRLNSGHKNVFANFLPEA